MNTKKIMALTLAALMAAGTTTAAFAAAGNELVFTDATGNTLFGEDDGILVKDADNEFAPGDTIYLQLNVNGSPEESDINRLNVYADWKVGGSNVESVDIVYKKGNFQSDSNYQTTGHKYTFKDGKFDGANEFVTIDGPLLEGDNLKNNEAVKALIDSKYVADKGYAYSNTYYETDAELAAKLVTDSKYTDSQVYYTVNGQQFESTATVTDALEAAGFETVGELSSDKL